MFRQLIYTPLWYVLLPIILLRLYWRGFKAPQYRLRWRERLGYYQQAPEQDLIWFHAVSVGEAEAVFPLIKLLQSCYPTSRFLVTTTTPTGSARVQAVLGDTVVHVYLPYDLPSVQQRFFTHFQPKIAVFMEKEIWPNLYATCALRGIPLFVINARLSAPSAQAYLKIPGLVKPALMAVEQIATQTPEDQARFIEIGADATRVQVLGNIKFDVQIETTTLVAGQLLRQNLFAQRFVWIIASSHAGEEEQLLNLYADLKTQIPELLLLLVPRHPERFQIVKALCVERQLKVVMRSEQSKQSLAEQVDIYIADSMGELKMLYAAADVAFVAGSLVPIGGHNVLEPAAIGVPVLFGPHMFNFQEIAQGMLAVGAALQCQDLAAVALAIINIYQDSQLRQKLIANAHEFVHKNQGAKQRVADLLVDYL
jgi:3-deoxy-D-manno-octulosonic-acid transferase